MKANSNTTELADDTPDEKLEPSSADDGPFRGDSSSSGASELRARAMRYRLLAETLSATSVIAAVQACAHELERCAALMEPSNAPTVSGG
jgi:hypothetical protein